MADFQSGFEESTQAIEGIVNTQLTKVPQWSNIPGGLAKTSSSSIAGYIWGYNYENNLFRSPLPSTGNWQEVAFDGKILDLITDTTNVYVLSDKGLSISPANGIQFLTIPIPNFSPVEVFSTHTFIWVQDASGNKLRCAKPCNAGVWQAADDTKIKITSSSDSALYGIDASGISMRTDETLQTGWSAIKGLEKTPVSKIIGQMDTTALYGIDQASKPFRCVGQDCSEPVQVDTAGYVPANLSPDPISRDIWMTTTTNAPLGNIFNKVDSPDYTTIMNKIAPLDKQRQEIIGEVENDYNVQTRFMVVEKQITDFIDFFKAKFKLSNETTKQNKNSAGKLEDDIRESQIKLDQINSTEPFLQIIIVTLIIVLLLYLFLSSILGTLIHMVAIIILLGGLYYAMNNNGQSTIFSAST